jgi:NodT family efflux transporter outer membrane factor (OMF) lipoprotein
MSRPARRTHGLAMIALTAAASCAVGPNYKRPNIETPPSFRFANGTKGAASMVDLPWWQVFGDDALQALLRRALESNFDLRVALARVEQSRAQARAAGAKLLPGIGVSGAAVYGNGSASPGSLALYTGGALATWQPDVFGGLRRSAESADASYVASEESRRNVWITVLADVAQAYFQLLALDVQREVTLRTIAARQETLELYRTQLQGGVATGLQVARAEADVYGAQGTLAGLEQQIATTEDSISLLLGRAPGSVTRPASVGVLSPPPEVPAGLPSSLLTRRPDVRQAEAQLVAANAQVGVETAKLFPTFPLTATAGLVSADLAGIAINSIKGWSYLLLGAMNWTAPILQGSALTAQVEAANAAKKAAVATYEETVFAALREVADTLVALQQLREQRGSDEAQVASLTRAVDISVSQFRGGTASYLDVVSAQENEFSAELSLAQLEGQQLVEFVQLYRALGGGWWLAEPGRPVAP